METKPFMMDCGCIHESYIDKNGNRRFVLDMNKEPDFPSCDKTWDLLGEGRTVAVFQLESNLGQTWSKKLKPKHLEHMSALGSILRPGCLRAETEDGISMTSHYCRRVNKEEDADAAHSSLSPILSDTENIMIYQEQLMKIAAEIAGFNKIEVDRIRKAVGKKVQKDLNEIGKLFVERATQKGLVTQNEAEAIFDNIKASGRYLFNKCLDPLTVVEDWNGILKCIEEIRIGEYIKCEGGYTKVLNKFESGQKVLYKITTENNQTLKCSMEHKIVCEDGIKRPLGLILKYDYKIKSDRYNPSKIVALECIGLTRSVDIEVDNEEHTFYGNGILVSNSHSYSYGSTGYDTAYLKSHFPVQYFTSCLSMAKDPEDKSILIQDAKSFGIQTNPPCIRNSKNNFYTDGEQIWFGINNVKKVGKKNVQKLKRILEENQKDMTSITWNEWLITCGQECNSILKILVMSGAFDCMNLKRQVMLEHLKIIKELSTGELNWLQNNLKDDFNEALKNVAKTKKNGGGCHNDKRVKILESMIYLLENPPSPLNDNVAWVVWAEDQTLGLPVSKNKVESYDLSNVNCSAQDYNNGMSGRLTLGIEISQVKEISTKKGKNAGAKMAFIVGSDKTGTIDNIVCFPEQWNNFKEFLLEGNTVFISGNRKSKDDGLIVSEVAQLI